MEKKTAIVIGASSGIGAALTRELVRAGYTVGICARRMDKLEALKVELGADAVHVAQLDVIETNKVESVIHEISEKLGGVNVLFNNAGVGFLTDELDLEKEVATISTNVCGFIAVAVAAYNLFKAQSYGHMVGISSIAALRGSGGAPAYCASKAAISNYMEGLYGRSIKEKAGIHITDIRPGFVDTAMAQGEGIFWMVSPEVAAKDIMKAMKQKRKVAYITKRWFIIALLLKCMPRSLLAKMA
ncbi:MAG: SDR family NAD(P)-dependent oxidoreductase [Pseudomonadota bacterium]|nr:SDR family NAD(P)-dependent oxidoreductase [Pseudomonadota bacterium]